MKHQRGIVGLSMDVINQRRNQKPEVRQAARQEDLAKKKEARKQRKEQRKENRHKSAGAGGSGPKVSRQQAKGGAMGGAKA